MSKLKRAMSHGDIKLRESVQKLLNRSNPDHLYELDNDDIEQLIHLYNNNTYQKTQVVINLAKDSTAEIIVAMIESGECTNKEIYTEIERIAKQCFRRCSPIDRLNNINMFDRWENGPFGDIMLALWEYWMPEVDLKYVNPLLKDRLERIKIELEKDPLHKTKE